MSAGVNRTEVDPSIVPAVLQERLRADLPISAIWLHHGECIVGLGVHDQAHLHGPQPMAQARQWWHQHLDHLDLNRVSPLALAGFAFDSHHASSTVLLPEAVLRHDSHGTHLSWIDQRPTWSSSTPTRLPEVTAVEQGPLDPAQWQHSVAQAVRLIRQRQLSKVVLARSILAHLDADLDLPSLAIHLAATYPQCFSFALDGWVGASPELLLNLQDKTVSSMVLAGTVATPDANSPASNEQAIAALQTSVKDLHEHRLSVESVTDALASCCSWVHAPAQPHVLRLAGVAHLATGVTGRANPGVSLWELLAALHPTAAICGAPRQAAAEVISRLEGLDRGRYTGPVGWFDASGAAQFAIALRCGHLEASQRLRLFAGAGIVADSDPAAELAETTSKVQPLLRALGGSRGLLH